MLIAGNKTHGNRKKPTESSARFPPLSYSSRGRVTEVAPNAEGKERGVSERQTKEKKFKNGRKINLEETIGERKRGGAESWR